MGWEIRATTWPGSSGFWGCASRKGTSWAPSKCSGQQYNSGDIHPPSPIASCGSHGSSLTPHPSHGLRFLAYWHQILPKRPRPAGGTQPSSKPSTPEMGQSASTLVLLYVQLATKKCYLQILWHLHHSPPISIWRIPRLYFSLLFTK